MQVPLRSMARDPELRPEQLRRWADLLAADRGKSATDVLPGEGRLSSEAAEFRRLQREVGALRIERNHQRRRRRIS